MNPNFFFTSPILFLFEEIKERTEDVVFSSDNPHSTLKGALFIKMLNIWIFSLFLISLTRKQTYFISIIPNFIVCKFVMYFCIYLLKPFSRTIFSAAPQLTRLFSQDVYDKVDYLSSLGKTQIAAVRRDADIGVAEAERDAGIRVNAACLICLRHILLCKKTG